MKNLTKVFEVTLEESLFTTLGKGVMEQLFYTTVITGTIGGTCLAIGSIIDRQKQKKQEEEA